MSLTPHPVTSDQTWGVALGISVRRRIMQNKTEQNNSATKTDKKDRMKMKNASEGMMFRRFFDRVYRLKENSVTYCTVKNNINKAASLVIETVQIYQLTFF